MSPRAYIRKTLAHRLALKVEQRTGIAKRLEKVYAKQIKLTEQEDKLAKRATGLDVQMVRLQEEIAKEPV